MTIHTTKTHHNTTMSPTRFPRMKKDPSAPPVPTRPSADVVFAAAASAAAAVAPVAVPEQPPVKYIAVSFLNYKKHEKTTVGLSTPKVKAFPESELRFYSRKDIEEFFQKHFATDASDMKSRTIEVSDTGIRPGYYNNTLPLSAIFATDLHHRMKHAEAWFFSASFEGVSSRSAADSQNQEMHELHRLVHGLRRDLESEKFANAALIKEVKSRAARKAEKIAAAKVDELAQAQFASLETALMDSVNKHLDQVFEKKTKKAGAKKAESVTVTSDNSSSCSMSFKLADVGVYPLTDGSGLARVVGKLPAHVGAMLLALDKLPEIKNINGTVAPVKNTGSCLELVAKIKFSQWSNEWLCSWGDNVKVAVESKSKSKFKSKCPQPTLITTLEEVQPRSENSTNSPRVFPDSVSAAPATPSSRIGCFKDVPPGLSGATEEIPWTVKVDTPTAKPDPHPVSDSDAFVCDYCLESIDDARFHCQSCVDFDVCSSCYPSRAKSHAQKHGFVQLDVKTGQTIESESSEALRSDPLRSDPLSSSGDVSTSSVRFPILNSASSSTTVAGVNSNEARGARSPARSGRSSLSSRSQSQSSFADVNVDDLLSDIGSYEHVNSDYHDYSDFEEHF